MRKTVLKNKALCPDARIRTVYHERLGTYGAHAWTRIAGQYTPGHVLPIDRDAGLKFIPYTETSQN